MTYIATLVYYEYYDILLQTHTYTHIYIIMATI